MPARKASKTRKGGKRKGGSFVGSAKKSIKKHAPRVGKAALALGALGAAHALGRHAARHAYKRHLSNKAMKAIATANRAGYGMVKGKRAIKGGSALGDIGTAAVSMLPFLL